MHYEPENFTVWFIASIVCSLLTLWNFVRWIQELLFYSRNGWNFTVDSGISTMYWGEDPIYDKDGEITNKLRPETRIKFGYPFSILLSLFFAIVSAIGAIKFWGQT